MVLRPDIAAAIDHVTRYAEREPWSTLRADYVDEILGGVLERFEIDFGELALELHSLNLAEMCLSFLLEQVFCADLGESGQNIMDGYLKRRGWQETPRARRYLQATRNTPASLYEIVGVQPGEWVDVRDLIRAGDVQRVGERMGSRSLLRWDRIAARVITVDDEVMFTGGILHLPQQSAERLELVLSRKRGKAPRQARHLADELGLDPKLLSATGDELLLLAGKAMLQIWVTGVLEHGRKPLPQLQNTDGEVLIFSSARLPLTTQDRDTLVQRLDALATWERHPGEELEWVHRSAPRVASLRDASGEIIKGSERCDTRTVLANARLEDGTLIVETNSKERMERALAEIEVALAGLLGKKLVSYSDAAAMLADKQDKGETSTLEPESVPGAEDLIRQFKDDHYHRVLDDPLPALGNRTPRECAKTAAGRKAVIRWLKELENYELRQARNKGTAPYNMSWMWRELGVSGET